jgi:hypothetical protein
MTDTRYDSDFYGWTQAQATALRAKDWAALAAFPEACPWGLAQILDEDFLPEG